MDPGFSMSVSSLRLTTPLKGKPFARPYVRIRLGRRSLPKAPTFAMTKISGLTLLYSIVKFLPVRPNPLWTSSTMSRMPCLSQTSRSPCKNAAGAGT